MYGLVTGIFNHRSKNIFQKFPVKSTFINAETSAAEILNEKILKILKLFQKMTYIKKIPTNLRT